MRTVTRASYLAVVAGACTWPWTGCVHEPTQQVAEVTVEPQPVAAPEPTSEERELRGLLELVESNPRLEPHVSDVLLILEARSAAAKGDTGLALRKWKHAATVAAGAMGKVALEGWIKAFAASLGERKDRYLLAKLLIAELDDGRISVALVEQGLDDELKMVAALERLIPEALAADDQAKPGLKEKLPAGVPSDDPLLLSRLKQRCGSDRHRYDWDHFAASLAADLKSYFLTLSSSCEPSNDGLAAADLHGKFAKQGKYALAIETAARAALAQRRTASRELAADTYRDLMSYWERGNPTAKDFGETIGTFLLRRINDHLWASRYRALIGDYELAKIYAQRALNYISEAYAQKGTPTQASFRKELATLRAEGYHILAFRIAVEKKEFQSAASLSKLAMETSYLDDEWKDRLGFLIGFYNYLEGNFDAAARQWETHLQQTSDESIKTSIYFWLSKSYQRLNNPARSSYYVETLVREHPLSFYAVIGLREAQLSEKPLWLAPFGDVGSLSERFRGRIGSYGLDDVRGQKDLSRLLLRAEILVSAKLQEWASLATLEFDRALRRQRSPKTAPATFVYLSRLHYGAGNYLSSIALTSELATLHPDFWRSWPEQLLVYFPQPYSDVYQRNAVDHALGEELLLAISRQESGFNPSIKSPANAIGLMQLIPPTGERFQGGLLPAAASIEELLLQPEANITIGSRYLKHLNVYYRGFAPAVFAAYNAGEYAVDTWLERRNDADPLAFIEMIPFGETKGYVKNVWRNQEVYRTIARFGPRLAHFPAELPPLKVAIAP